MLTKACEQEEQQVALNNASLPTQLSFIALPNANVMAMAAKGDWWIQATPCEFRGLAMGESSRTSADHEETTSPAVT